MKSVIPIQLTADEAEFLWALTRGVGKGPALAPQALARLVAAGLIRVDQENITITVAGNQLLAARADDLKQKMESRQ